MKVRTMHFEIDGEEKIEISFNGSPLMVTAYLHQGRPMLRIMTDMEKQRRAEAGDPFSRGIGFRDRLIELKLHPKALDHRSGHFYDIYEDVSMTEEFNPTIML